MPKSCRALLICRSPTLVAGFVTFGALAILVPWPGRVRVVVGGLCGLLTLLAVVWGATFSKDEVRIRTFRGRRRIPRHDVEHVVFTRRDPSRVGSRASPASYGISIQLKTDETLHVAFGLPAIGFRVARLERRLRAVGWRTKHH